jgi:hypothetical protein
MRNIQFSAAMFAIEKCGSFVTIVGDDVSGGVARKRFSSRQLG